MAGQTDNLKYSDVAMVFDITDKQLEEIGELAEKAENLYYASTIPGIPANVHIHSMSTGLEEIGKALKAIYEDLDEQR